MKVYHVQEPEGQIHLENGKLVSYKIERFLKFIGEDLIKEKEGEGYTVCILLGKDETGFENTIVWSAQFLK